MKYEERIIAADMKFLRLMFRKPETENVTNEKKGLCWTGLVRTVRKRQITFFVNIYRQDEGETKRDKETETERQRDRERE